MCESSLAFFPFLFPFFISLTPLLFFPSYFSSHEGKGQCSSAGIEGCLLVAAGRDWSTPGEARALQAELQQSTWGAWASDWGLPVVCSLLSFLGAGIPGIRVGETQVRVGETRLKEVNPEEAGETEGGGSLGNGRRA